MFCEIHIANSLSEFKSVCLLFVNKLDIFRACQHAQHLPAFKSFKAHRRAIPVAQEVAELSSILETLRNYSNWLAIILNTDL